VAAARADRKQLVVSAQDELRAYDPQSGELLWKIAAATGWVAPSPVFARGLIFAASGKNGPIVAARPTVSDKPAAAGGPVAAGSSAAEIVWQVDGAGPYVCSPIAYGDYLYVHNEAGVLACYEAATGRQVYRRRLNGKFTASAAAGDGRLYLTNEDGTTYVVEAGAAFKLLAANSLEEYSLASPAISGRRLFLRTKQHLYCIAPGTERSR